MPRSYVYHWTHRSNLPSIMREGIDPAYSEGRAHLSWVCGPRRIGWALAHIAQRHGWEPDDMVLLKVDGDLPSLRPTFMAYVYNSREVIPPASILECRMTHEGDFIPFNDPRG